MRNLEVRKAVKHPKGIDFYMYEPDSYTWKDRKEDTYRVEYRPGEDLVIKSCGHNDGDLVMKGTPSSHDSKAYDRCAHSIISFLLRKVKFEVMVTEEVAK